VWLDTADMLANPLTKLNSDGTIPLYEMRAAIQDCYWNPTLPWKFDGIKQHPNNEAKSSVRTGNSKTKNKVSFVDSPSVVSIP